MPTDDYQRAKIIISYLQSRLEEKDNVLNASSISNRWKFIVYSLHLRNVYWGCRKIWITLL